MLRASKKYSEALSKCGAKDAERKRFEAMIADCIASGKAEETSDAATLEDVRQDLKDQLGAYRAAADLVAHGIDGKNVTLAREIKADGPVSVTGRPSGRRRNAAGNREATKAVATIVRQAGETA